MKGELLVVVLLAICVSIPVSSAVTISIESANVLPGETFIASLMINNVTGVGAVEVNLSYNSSVVIPIDVINSDFDLPPQGNPLVNPEAGFIIINAMQFDSGLSGNVKLGDISLKAVGNIFESSSLSLTGVIVHDMSQVDIPVDSLSDGVFTIIPLIHDPYLAYGIVYNATTGYPEKGVQTLFIYHGVTVDTEITDDEGKYVLIFPPEAQYYPEDPGFNVTFNKGNYSGPTLYGEINLSQAGKSMSPVGISEMPVEVQVTLDNTTVTVGDDIEVEIVVDPHNNITGMQAILDYNPDNLALIDVIEGDLFQRDPKLQSYFVYSNSFYHSAILDEGSCNTSGTFAKINFTTVSSGTVEINLSEVKVSGFSTDTDDVAYILNSTVEGVVVTINMPSSPPPPPSPTETGTPPPPPPPPPPI